MDFSPQIISAMQEKLDIGQAFPIVYTMTPHTVELFAGSVFTKLHNRIVEAMKEEGEEYVAKNDPFGLSLLLMRNRVKLPPQMLLDICTDIVKKSRGWAKWILPTGDGLPGQEGGLWHCKLYIDLAQDEKLEQKFYS